MAQHCTELLLLLRPPNLLVLHVHSELDWMSCNLLSLRNAIARFPFLVDDDLLGTGPGGVTVSDLPRPTMQPLRTADREGRLLTI